MDILIEIIKYIFLGFIQGITEVLPVSSSGHVLFFQKLFNVEIDSSAMLIMILNLGSMLAIFYFLRSEIKTLFLGFNRYVFKRSRDIESKKNYKYVKTVFVGILPIFLFGYLVNLIIEPIYKDYTLLVIGIGSLMTATILYFVRYTPNENIKKEITTKDALFIGIFQLIAVFPGLSRLGVVTASGLHRKISMDSILKFTFLMFIPISVGSTILELISYKVNQENMVINFDFTNVYHLIYYILGFVISIVSTYFALKWLFILFRRGKLAVFYVYNFIFGFLCILISITQ
jgi:undecaprenyl-diphosphatase